MPVLMRMSAMSDFGTPRHQFAGRLGLCRLESHSTQLHPLACHETANIPSQAKLHAHGCHLSYLHPRHLEDTYSIAQIRTQTCLPQELVATQRVLKAQNPATQWNQRFEWVMVAYHRWKVFPCAVKMLWRIRSRG